MVLCPRKLTDHWLLVYVCTNKKGNLIYLLSILHLCGVFLEGGCCSQLGCMIVISTVSNRFGDIFERCGGWCGLVAVYQAHCAVRNCQPVTYPKYIGHVRKR
jgi:hypothetical protein